MPIAYRIDHEKRIVIAIATGFLAEADVLAYQTEVWSRGDLASYNELMDLSGVESLEKVHPDRIRHLAEVAFKMQQVEHPTRFALIAVTDFHYGLGRMYQAFRQLQGGGKHEVGVFRSKKEALDWLGMKDLEI